MLELLKCDLMNKKIIGLIILTIFGLFLFGCTVATVGVEVNPQNKITNGAKTIPINQIVTKGFYTINVKELTIGKNADNNTILKLSLSITNNSEIKRNVNTSAPTIIIGTKQYEAFSIYAEIYPKVEKDFELSFENIPKNITAFVFALSTRCTEDFEPCDFKYNIYTDAEMNKSQASVIDSEEVSPSQVSTENNENTPEVIVEDCPDLSTMKLSLEKNESVDSQQYYEYVLNLTQSYDINGWTIDYKKIYNSIYESARFYCRKGINVGENSTQYYCHPQFSSNLSMSFSTINYAVKKVIDSSGNIIQSIEKSPVLVYKIENNSIEYVKTNCDN